FTYGSITEAMVARIAGRFRAVNVAEPIRRGRRPPRTADRSGACRRPVNEKKKPHNYLPRVRSRLLDLSEEEWLALLHVVRGAMRAALAGMV
ncbi:MAG: hypothetical protein AABZ70_11715, partial [candidate division NC10 bacterium]